MAHSISHLNSSKVTLHLQGLFHTIPSDAYSHCAFTGKVLRFSKMMKLFGWHIIEYANGESESDADEKVQILSEEELRSLTTRKEDTDFVGNDAVIGSPCWIEFNKRIIIEMAKRVKKGDLILHPFGKVHSVLKDIFPDCSHIETGIGYNETWLDFRIFESSAWMHWHLGKENNAHGKNYNWVVPNYYDLDDWDICLNPEDYVVFLGRITELKGMPTLIEIANHMPEQKFIICGQGEANSWLQKVKHGNVKYMPPISGRTRSELLGKAKCAIMPTVFIEPFAGAGVEAQLCGTPLVAINYGAFMETIIQGVTGFRCNTLGDWISAIRKVHTLDRTEVARIARSKYSLQTCGKEYDAIFKSIIDLNGKGWYNLKSHRFDDDARIDVIKVDDID